MKTKALRGIQAMSCCERDLGVTRQHWDCVCFGGVGGIRMCSDLLGVKAL